MDFIFNLLDRIRGRSVTDAPPTRWNDIPELAGVSMDWIAHFDMAELGRVLKALEGIETTPPRNMIFEAFRYSSRPKMVIVGLDMHSEEARNNIAECLGPVDLRLWALQGVLMIGASLTTIPGVASAHLELWRPFVRRLLDSLGQQVEMLLWGEEAQEVAATCLAKQKKYWPHPPTCRKFIGCDHFSKSSVCWSGNERVYCAISGSCDGEKAGFAAIINGSYFGTHVEETCIRGVVLPHPYSLENGKIVVQRFAKTVPVSRDRAELVAAIYALAALRHRLVKNSEICSMCCLASIAEREKDLGPIMTHFLGNTKLRQVKEKIQLIFRADLKLPIRNMNVIALSEEAKNLEHCYVGGAMGEFLSTKI